MNQQTIFKMCMNVIEDAGVSLAFSRAYLYTSTLRLERTASGGFVIKTLAGGRALGTLVDSNHINKVYTAYTRKKDELTLRADGDYLRRN